MSKTTENTGKKKKNPIVIALIVLAVIWFLIPTGNSKKTEEPAPAPETTEATKAAEPFEVTINPTAHRDEAGGLVIDIETNLPDEADLIATISFGGPDDTHRGGTHVIIAGGKGSTESINLKDAPDTWDADLSISMSIPRKQSDAVRAVIGETGENMTGPLVKPAEITDDNVVSALFALHVGEEITLEPEEDYQYTIFPEYDDEEEAGE